MAVYQRGLAVLLVMAVAGCGADNGLNLARVHGTVSFKGQPVGHGEISFLPDESRHNKGMPAMSRLKSDGTYSLATESSGDGAIVGFHRVVIVGFDPEPVSMPEAPVAKSSKKAAPSPLGEMASAKVQSASQQRVATREHLIRRGANYYRLVTPEKLGNPGTSQITVEVKSGSNKFHFAIQEDGSVKVE